MFAELGCLAGGIIPGGLLRHSRKAQKATALATAASIYALLFILGAKIGGDAPLFNALGALGLQGAVIALCCSLGSVFCVMPACSWFGGRSGGRQTPGGNALKGFLGSLYILGCFCLGLGLGRLGFLPGWVGSGGAPMCILWVMLFCVGMGIGFDLSSLRIVRAMGARIALVPLLTVIGTGAGAVLAAFVLDRPAGAGPGVKETLLVGAGFGYYSLSSVLVSNHGLVALGSVTLIANVLRELFTLLFTPALARLFGPMAPLAAAGAPGMDTCLPVIVRFTGERCGIIALFNGLVLTMLVPVLVPFILSFF